MVLIRLIAVFSSLEIDKIDIQKEILLFEPYLIFIYSITLPFIIVVLVQPFFLDPVTHIDMFQWDW